MKNVVRKKIVVKMKFLGFVLLLCVGVSHCLGEWNLQRYSMFVCVSVENRLIYGRTVSDSTVRIETLYLVNGPNRVLRTFTLKN